MTADEREHARLSLAHTMLSSLPRFGRWAESVSEFKTPHGTIGYRQAGILWVLRFALLPPDEMTPTCLAHFFRVQPSVITRALAKLEHGGFITRSIDLDDTRVSRISITPQGTAISVYVEQLYIDDLLAALAPVSDCDIDGLLEAVATLDIIVERLEMLRLGRTRRALALTETHEPANLA
jgi:DNA-binding MarR family transcriptional regulator